MFRKIKPGYDADLYCRFFAFTVLSQYTVRRISEMLGRNEDEVVTYLKSQRHKNMKSLERDIKTLLRMEDKKNKDNYTRGNSSKICRIHGGFLKTLGGCIKDFASLRIMHLRRKHSEARPII